MPNITESFIAYVDSVLKHPRAYELARQSDYWCIYSSRGVLYLVMSYVRVPESDLIFRGSHQECLDKLVELESQ